MIAAGRVAQISNNNHFDSVYDKLKQWSETIERDFCSRNFAFAPVSRLKRTLGDDDEMGKLSRCNNVRTIYGNFRAIGRVMGLQDNRMFNIEKELQKANTTMRRQSNQIAELQTEVRELRSLQHRMELMQRSMEQMQRSMEQSQRRMEQMLTLSLQSRSLPTLPASIGAAQLENEPNPVVSPQLPGRVSGPLFSLRPPTNGCFPNFFYDWHVNGYYATVYDLHRVIEKRSTARTKISGRCSWTAR